MGAATLYYSSYSDGVRARCKKIFEFGFLDEDEQHAAESPG
eukprot:COSAG02_NODE_17143_length_1025_cov_1.473002_2_plen_41_part_01